MYIKLIKIDYKMFIENIFILPYVKGITDHIEYWISTISKQFSSSQKR